jgi:hypothetical protein
MDNKYGKLFTADDVRQIVERCLEEDVDNETHAEHIIDQYEGKFAGAEPVFVLLGRDRYARGTLHKYYDLCERGQKVDPEHLRVVERTINDFEEYAAVNTVKDPTS